MARPRFRWVTYQVDVHPHSPMAQLPGVRLAPLPATGMVQASIDLPDMCDYPTPEDKADALLAVAAEVEHALLVQYLYSAYSLKNRNDPTLNMDQQKAVGRWKTGPVGIAQIAREEMGHLMTVQNLRILLGFGPTFQRDEFPMLPDLFPFAFHLGPLTQKTLAEYVIAESPTNDATHPKLPDIAKLAACQAGMPINHVGNLYGLLGVVFAASPEEIRRDAAQNDPWYVMVRDIAAAAYQQDPSPEAWHLGDDSFRAAKLPQAEATDLQVSLGNTQPPHPGIRLWQCANRADAKAALRDIGLQGEGAAQLSGEESHFQRFYDIFTGANDFLPFPAEGEWVPTSAVPTDPTISDDDSDPDAITEPRAKDYATLADLRYALVLGLLGHYLVTDPARRKALKLGDWAIQEMGNLKSLSATLIGLPRSKAGPGGGTAALPFGLPDELVPPTTEDDSRALLVDRFRRVIEQEDHLFVTYNDGAMMNARDDHKKKLALLEQQVPATS